MSDASSDKATDGSSDSHRQDLAERAVKLLAGMCDESGKMNVAYDSDVETNSGDKGKRKCPEGKNMDPADYEKEMPDDELEALMDKLKVRDGEKYGVKDSLVDQVQPENTKQINDGDEDVADFYVANEEGEGGETTYSLAKHIVLVFEHNDGNNCHFKLAKPPTSVEIESPDVWLTVQYRLRSLKYATYGSLIKNYWRKNAEQRKWEQVRLVKIAQILTRMQRAEHAKKTEAMRAKAKEWAAIITSGRKLTQTGKDSVHATEESLRVYNDEHDGVLDDIFAETTAAMLSRPENYDADDERETETEPETETDEAETEAAGLGMQDGPDNDNNSNDNEENRAGPSTPHGPQLDDPLELVLKAARMAVRAQATAEMQAQLTTLDQHSLGADVSEPEFTPPEVAKPKTKGLFVPKKEGDGHIVQEKTRGWVKKQKRGRKG